MLKKIQIFVILFLSGASLYAQSQSQINSKEITSIDQMMDDWHERASRSDTSYFELFAPNAMFLGSDSEEIWTAEEFENLYKSYFVKGDTWNFTKIDRNVYLGDYGHYAWIDEILDTWMGLCRGTGVLEKNTIGEWRIKHYSLTVLVPDELIKEYIQLLKKEK